MVDFSSAIFSNSLQNQNWTQIRFLTKLTLTVSKLSNCISTNCETEIKLITKLIDKFFDVHNTDIYNKMVIVNVSKKNITS